MLTLGKSTSLDSVLLDISLSTFTGADKTAAAVTTVTSTRYVASTAVLDRGTESSGPLVFANHFSTFFKLIP